MVLFIWCLTCARCNKWNILETSRGVQLRGKHWGGEKERREWRRNKPEATKMTYKKKIVFISHVHKKGKEKSQTELKQWEKAKSGCSSLEWTWPCTWHWPPPLHSLMSSLAWRASAELLTVGICHQFCNCRFLVPPSCIASLPRSWAQPRSTLWCLWSSSEALILVSAKWGSYDSNFFTQRGCCP